MGSLSIWHWLIVLAVVLLLFGSKKLPDAARGLGRSMRIFKSEMHEMQKDGQTVDAQQPHELPAGGQPQAAQYVQPQAGAHAMPQPTQGYAQPQPGQAQPYGQPQAQQYGQPQAQQFTPPQQAQPGGVQQPGQQQNPPAQGI